MSFSSKLFKFINLSLFITFFSCNFNEKDKNFQLNDKYTQTVKKENGLYYKLFSKIYNNNANTLISPINITNILNILKIGSNGSTNKEILKILDNTDNNIDYLYNDINYNYPKDIFNISNSLWINKDQIILNKDFQDKINLFYKTEAISIDFDDKKSISKINNWVKDKTNNKIENLLDNLPLDSGFQLISTSYFKMPWNDKFSPKNTTNDFFYSENNKQNISMMNSERSFLYYINNKLNNNIKDNFELARIEYLEDSQINFYILLPSKNTNLKTLVDNITMEDIDKSILLMNNVKGKISIPKFNIIFSSDLKNKLIEMGLNLVFDKTKSDLTKMGLSNNNIFVEKIIHKTIFSIDENGTEASSVTKTDINTLDPEKTVNLVINRPFLFFIKDDKNDLVLFIGAVNTLI